MDAAPPSLAPDGGGGVLLAPRRDPRARRSYPGAVGGLRLALAGGGTGGHVLPGVHLLAHARGEAAPEDVLWFQSGRRVEEQALPSIHALVARERFERAVLRLEPEGGGAPSTFDLALLTPPAILIARKALQRHRSQVLLALGGFTCLPAVAAARTLGVPVALLEINASAGRASRVLTPLSRRVLHAWSRTRGLPAPGSGARHVWTGPPLAPAYVRGAPAQAQRAAASAAEGFDPERPLLVVLGGSQGARSINAFLRAHRDVLLAARVQVLHQTGPGRLAEGAEPADGYRPVEYLGDVHRALCAATLVLCRGGASTLAEVGALRVPAWVVPYPHHADRHQEHNARQLGAGVRILPDERLDADAARELTRACSSSAASAREAMSAALEGLVPLDGAARIWDQLLELARGFPPEA